MAKAEAALKGIKIPFNPAVRRPREGSAQRRPELRLSSPDLTVARAIENQFNKAARQEGGVRRLGGASRAPGTTPPGMLKFVPPNLPGVGSPHGGHKSPSNPEQALAGMSVGGQRVEVSTSGAHGAASVPTLEKHFSVPTGKLADAIRSQLGKNARGSSHGEL
eukprot:COSAG01_NODE_12478_length_1732_cov_1.105940_3_plen_163_part_00